MANDLWNKVGYFSGIPEDFSNYRWCKGEKINPYIRDTTHTMTAQFWKYGKEFHLAFLDRCDSKAYLKKSMLPEKRHYWMIIYLVNHLTLMDIKTDWSKIFKTGKQ